MDPLQEQVDGEHYKVCAIQPIDFIHANKLSFLEGNVVKRIVRHRFKGGVTDLRKAIHELRLIAKMEYQVELE